MFLAQAAETGAVGVDWNQLWTLMVPYAVSIGKALAILIIGWLIGWVVSAIIKAVLKRTDLDNKLAKSLGMGETSVPVEVIVSQAIFYVIMLFVVVGALQAVNLSYVSDPLSAFLKEVMGYLPNLLGGLGLAIVGWVLAYVVRSLLRTILGNSKLDEKLADSAGAVEGEQKIPLSETIANLAYWLVLLMFLPIVLGVLELDGLMAPVQDLVRQVLLYLPNLLSAGAIFLIGYLLARIVRQIVIGLLSTVGLDSLGEKLGLQAEGKGQSLSKLCGMVVYAIIIIHVLISALNALKIDAISKPATEMLNTMYSYVPNVIGAAVIILVAWFVGKIVAGLITSILTNAGFNRVFTALGLGVAPTEGQQTPSQVAGYLAHVAIVLFASMQAFEQLEFNQASELVRTFIEFAGQIVMGLLIFGLGLFLANVVARTLASSGTKNAKILSRSAQIAIIALTGAMALQRMGIANEIVNLAFGLILGAIALAAALAFGLGCRDLASREAEKLMGKAKEGGDGPTNG